MRFLPMIFAAAILSAQYTAPGPAVGSRVPAFQALDQDGVDRNLASVAGPKGTMLVFFRSADW
ncbi:MAG: hypothetical protein ABI823_09855 [Bryobacteraceae bacterium]